MMSESGLAGEIKSALDGVDNAVDSNTILGNTVASHILNNAQFTFLWAAIQTLPPVAPAVIPDPVTSANGAFVSLGMVLTPSGLSDPVAAKAHTKNEMIAGMTSATYNITDTGFLTTPPGSMSTSPTLNTLDLQIAVTTSQDSALLDLSTKIITWVKQLAPTGAVTGTHVAGGITYTGTGTVTSIL